MLEIYQKNSDNIVNITANKTNIYIDFQPRLLLSQLLVLSNTQSKNIPE